MHETRSLSPQSMILRALEVEEPTKNAEINLEDDK